MEYHVGQYRVTCPVCPSQQVRPFTTPHLRDLKDLSVILAAVGIIISMGLFCIPFLLLAQQSYKDQVLSALEQTLSEKCADNFRKM